VRFVTLLLGAVLQVSKSPWITIGALINNLSRLQNKFFVLISIRRWLSANQPVTYRCISNSDGWLLEHTGLTWGLMQL